MKSIEFECRTKKLMKIYHPDKFEGDKDEARVKFDKILNEKLNLKQLKKTNTILNNNPFEIINAFA